jgi:hypothetical protein
MGFNSAFKGLKIFLQISWIYLLEDFYENSSEICFVNSFKWLLTQYFVAVNYRLLS